MYQYERDQQLLATGQITRREFLRRLSILGVSTAAASNLIVPIGQAAVPKPKRGGLLKLGVSGGSTSDTMDPMLGNGDYTYIHSFTTYNNLVELTADRKPIPELASSWESNKDLTVWTFKLRKGVEFHNGKTLDADDVVYSLKRHIDKDSKSPAKGMMGDFESIKADGDGTVVITLNRGNADVPYILSWFLLCIVPKNFDDWAHAIGTGPYELVNYEPGVQTNWKRNSNYWKEGRAWVDAVQVTAINDGTARVGALRTGEVHGINSVATLVAKRISGLPEIGLVDSPGLYMYDAAMNTTLAPYRDNNVRLALKYACDRNLLLKNGLRGYGRLGLDVLIPPNDPLYNTELKPHEYDPDKARYYLKLAGHDALSIGLVTSIGAFPEADDFGVLYQSSAKNAGIDLNVNQAPADGYWANIWMKKPFCTAYWGTYPTAGMLLSTAYTCGNSWNETFWCREDFDKLLLKAKANPNTEERKEQYWKLQEMIHQDGGTLAMAFADAIDAYHESVKGTGPDTYRALMGCRVAERVWLDT